MGNIDAEERIYSYIRAQLVEMGWNSANPRNGGDVYSQREFSHDLLLRECLGADRPENVVRIPWKDGFHYWVIEAKPSFNEMDKAINQAKGYAQKINEHAGENFSCFITGVAGSVDENLVRVNTQYFDGNQWSDVAINRYKTTGFLTKGQCHDILSKNSSGIELFDDRSEMFKKRADAINKSFHDNDIPVADRAKVMGALLLALADESDLHLDKDPKYTVAEINNHIGRILRKHGKADFFDTIKITLPSSPKTHEKHRKALVEVIALLRAMNIRSAINSGDDALGKFYETFLKYANGAKEMGIVLTPRHITKFAAEALGVSSKDRVFDPTCGTGGFLVAAMDFVRRNESDTKEFENEGLWGVEVEDSVYVLALVNMIFRGDGKSGLRDGSCFSYDFRVDERGKSKVYDSGKKAKPHEIGLFSRVFMNPPFKKKIDKEIKFVDYALEQCERGALLFAILPHSVIGGQSSHNWRIDILKRHKLKSVIRFLPRLFSPVRERTYGLVLEAHNPHDFVKDEVFFSFLFDDESHHRPSKMQSTINVHENVEETTILLRDFLAGKKINGDKPRVRTVCKISNEAKNYNIFEPQFHVKNKKPEYAASTQLKAGNLHNALLLNGTNQSVKLKEASLHKFSLMEFGKPVKSKLKESLKNLEDGDIPIISSSAFNNGIVGRKQVDEEFRLKNLLSVAKPQEGKLACISFFHPYTFAAIDTVHLFDVCDDFKHNMDRVIYLCQEIGDSNWWRFDYARTVKLEEVEVYLPVKSDGSIDFQHIEHLVKNTHNFTWSNFNELR